MTTYRYSAYAKALLSFLIILFPFLLTAQTIDLSKPVGTSLGSGGVTGTGGSTYSIPIFVLPGTNGMQPNVKLVYNSQANDGIAGWGWNLSCLSVISRAGKNNYYNGITGPVKYLNSNDAFVLDGQRMFVTSGTNGANGAVYGLENETFSKIESFGGSETLGPEWFRVTTKNGTVLEYGHETNTKMATNDGTSTMLWFLNKIIDAGGNYQRYVYSINATDRTYALTEIQYTGNAAAGLTPYNKIVFTYGIRNDWQSSSTWDAGSSLRKAFNLLNISVRNSASQTVRSYDLVYQFIKNQYFLSTVTEKGSNGIGMNPLVFTYGANTGAADVATSIQYPNMHKGNVYAGDFDGDGKQDVLSSNYRYDNNNIPYYTSYDVLSDFSTYAGQPAISFYYNFPIPQNGATEVQGSSNGYYNFNTYDYDGDSKEDVLLVNTLVSGGDRMYNGIRINYSRKFSVYSGPTYDSVSYPYIPRSSLYTQDFKYIYRSGSTFGSYFVPGDFDGDGAQDYILVLGINYANAFKGFFSSPKRGIFNQEIALFGVEGTSSDPFYANSIASANKLMPIDFDGDGKQEILVVKNNQSYVLSVYPVSATSGYNYAAQVLYTLPAIKSNLPIFPGDFNGDGKTDFLYRSSPLSTTEPWYLLTSTGKAYNSQTFGFYNRPYLAGDGATSAHHLVVADLNGDGKTDVWHSLDLASGSRHTMYYSNGLSFLIENYELAVSTNGAPDANTVVGDFNGDGKADILGVNSGSYGRFIYPRPFKEQRNLTKVVNGLGAQEGYNYLLTNQSSIYSRSGIYEYDIRGTGIGMGANGNPYNVVSSPVYVVSQSYRSNGISNGINYTAYQYTDMAHHPVRGFLGFKKVSSTDGASGIQSVTENSIQGTLLASHPVRQYSLLGAEILNDVKITDTLKRASTSYFDKRFVHQVLKTLASDGVTGSATETSNTWDNYGNVTQSITKTGSLSGETVSAVETTTTNTVYGTYGTPFPASPENVTVKNVRVGQAEASKATIYTYNSIGQVTTKIEFPAKAKAVTNTFAYDIYGNLKQSDMAATGLTARTQKFTYDNLGRFITLKETVGGSVTKKETFVYEAIAGKIASITASDGLLTSYQYDALGRLSVTTVPDGYNITQSFAWETSTGRYSLNSTRPGGGRNVKTFYDLVGREVRSELSGYNNATLVSFKTYNNKGQVVNDAAPYYSNEAAVTSTTQYDNYDRITQASNGTTTLTTTYAKLSNGQYKITTTNTAGQASSKTQDAAGRVIAATDNGGSISYVYNSMGKQTQVVVNGVTVTSSAFDEYGNQINLTDKNAGTYTYDYDAFKQLISQKNPLNQTTTTTYDGFGRTLTRTGPEGTTTYEYCQTSSTGYCNNNPVKITGFAGDVKEIVYNSLQRTISEKITIDGVSHTAQHAYDTYGNLVKTTYPSGLVITRTFDHDGTETAVNMGEGSVATPLFAASGMNSLGKYTSYSYGNGKSTTESFNLALGVPVTSVTAGVQNMSYTFNTATGNLTSRKDVNRNLEETFTYDYLNRLLTTKVNTVQQLNVSYDGSSGASIGNITSKTDAGNYTYDGQKNNAISYVTNPAGAQVPPAVISQNQQNITYTAFGKAATITESTYQLAYTYANDYQRIKGVLKQNGTVIETKYYLGTYETQVRNGVSRQLHYIDAGNGLCAIIVREGTTNNVYYTYNDYLGNILTVTNAAGTVIASQNFDAWGRYRNPADWTYTNVPASADWLYTGFTGHEYLKEFSLVNMNGRIYDPILGRVLSADNYVPNPWNTQGYNRYAYGLNNPLMYTDPDGEWIHLVIGAIIGGVMNVVMNFGKIDNFWEGLGYFGVGAAAGAVGAGVGSGVSSVIAGGSFGAGFIGTAASTATSSFFTGAAIGGAGGFSSGLVSGTGNGLIEGKNLGQALNSGLKDGVIGGVTGGLVGGAVSGIDAALHGRRFFDGATVQKTVQYDGHLPYVQQQGDYNCGPATAESASGRTVTQQQFRAALAGDPNQAGVGDVDLWREFTRQTGRRVDGIAGGMDVQNMLGRLQNQGGTLSINLRATADMGHLVMVNRITEKVVTKISGRVTTKLLLYVMDPARGQYVQKGASEATGAFRIFHIF